MKRIVKFTAPNGEFIEWGEFDEKLKFCKLEIKEFDDDGKLHNTDSMEFSFPKELTIRSNLSVLSSAHYGGFSTCENNEKRYTNFWP